jgi:hypothetical protein
VHCFAQAADRLFAVENRSASHDYFTSSPMSYPGI